jgi:hypothetical protein
MLRVSIHAGPLREISRFNRVDWVDIGYDQLGVLANYKVVLFNVGEGVSSPVRLSSYPRWSASLWDLTARAIALGLSPDRKNPEVVGDNYLDRRVASRNSVTGLPQSECYCINLDSDSVSTDPQSARCRESGRSSELFSSLQCRFLSDRCLFVY